MKPLLLDGPAGRNPAPAMHRSLDRKRRQQRGYVMVLSMLILLLITIMSISMSKSFFMEEGMAGNIREKNRSLNAAQAALTFAEQYAKATSTAPLGANCTIGGNATTSLALPAIQICTNPASTTTSPNGVTLMPLQGYFPVATLPGINGNITTAGGTDKYFAAPGVYILLLGTTTGGGHIYQVTAYGYGGSQNSVSIVQSVFYVTPGTVAL